MAERLGLRGGAEGLDLGLWLRGWGLRGLEGLNVWVVQGLAAEGMLRGCCGAVEFAIFSENCGRNDTF